GEREAPIDGAQIAVGARGTTQVDDAGDGRIQRDADVVEALRSAEVVVDGEAAPIPGRAAVARPVERASGLAGGGDDGHEARDIVDRELAVRRSGCGQRAREDGRYVATHRGGTGIRRPPDPVV